MLTADIIGLSLAFLVAQRLTPAGAEGVDAAWEAVLFCTITLPAWVVAAKISGLYDRDEERASHTTTDDLAGVFQLVTFGVWLLFVVSWVTDLTHPSVGRFVLFWALSIALVTTSRAGARSFCRRRPAYRQRTVIVGAGGVGQLIARKFLHHPEYGIELLGFVDGEPKAPHPALEGVPLLGQVSDLPQLVSQLGVERVVVAFSRDPREQMVELVRSLGQLDVQVDMVPRFFEVIGPKVSIHEVEGLALLGLPPLRLSRSSRLVKRALDFALAAAGLVLLAPLFAVVALAVKLGSPGPVFFRQVRMGAGGRTFRIFKFRTMVADADARKSEVAHLSKHADGSGPRMFKIPRDPRVTRVGRLLRRTSLDELPQLLNVLRGEMSLVGPRPLILDEHRQITDWGQRRLDLKPGMTGIWQVLGRSDIPFGEMLRLDYLYVTGWSLWGDVRLVLRTLPKVVTGGGAY